MDDKKEYSRWLNEVKDLELHSELEQMDTKTREDAFYRDLAFGTGGLRGILGAGTNRMNRYVVARASQGLSRYLTEHCSEKHRGVVIGYDSRRKSDVFAKTAASVFAANGIPVYIWPELNPVPTVSFAVRKLTASAGVMITASHNPGHYNGYKVYGSDGCQITTEAAEEIFEQISRVDIFHDVCTMDFEQGVKEGQIAYIAPSVLDSYIANVKKQSVLFGDEVQRDAAIVYSPLNGTGLKPVTRVLQESGFTNLTVVEEQRNPDDLFPTCPYPNPEVKEAMELGLQYCERVGADLLLATDPDCDRLGIAVRDETGYRLLTGNEVGLLLLDFICGQRQKHHKMPKHPVFIKTIVTVDLAERIAEHYGVQTRNVLTGFKFIGEIIGKLEDVSDYIFGFEESYGYLTGAYVRDKDGVNAAFMVCEMFAYYKTRGISLIQKLEELYAAYGYCLNTLHSYEFPGSAGMQRMAGIMEEFRGKTGEIAGYKINKVEDYLTGQNGLPGSNVLKFYIENASVVIRPSGTEPKLKVYISVTTSNKEEAQRMEKDISGRLGDYFR